MADGVSNWRDAETRDIRCPRCGAENADKRTFIELIDGRYYCIVCSKSFDRPA